MKVMGLWGDDPVSFFNFEVSFVKTTLFATAALLCAGLVCVGEAYAFQDTGRSVTAAERAGAHGDELPTKSLSKKQLALSGTETDGKKADKKSPSLYIPGLGSVDALPDVDFGLELLYQDEEIVAPVDKDDGVAIKGRLKHKF